MDTALAGVNEQLRRVTGGARALSRRARRQMQQVQRRRDQALRVAAMAYCHEPEQVGRLVTAVFAREPELSEPDPSTVRTQITDVFLGTDTEALSMWLDWEVHSCTRLDVTQAQRLAQRTPARVD